MRWARTGWSVSPSALRIIRASRPARWTRSSMRRTRVPNPTLVIPIAQLGNLPGPTRLTGRRRQQSQVYPPCREARSANVFSHGSQVCFNRMRSCPIGHATRVDPVRFWRQTHRRTQETSNQLDGQQCAELPWRPGWPQSGSDALHGRNSKFGLLKSREPLRGGSMGAVSGGLTLRASLPNMKCTLRF